MSPTFTFINPNKSDEVFNNLKFAIQEVKLERKIADLEDLASLYKSTIPSRQARFIRRNIATARVQLKMIRLSAERQMNYRTQA